MTDIYDIKANILWLPIDIFYSIIFLFFYIFFYLILNKYFSKNKEKNTEIFQLNISTQKEKIDYLEFLQNIEENYLNSEKSIFYSKLSEIIRLFLEEKLGKAISKMTFDEIKDLNLEKNLESILKNIYFKEFKREVEDDINSRESIILKVKKLFINK